MSARHRLSKLLLRQGIVYSGGKAWTTTHDQWLRRQRFDQPGLQHAFDAAYDAVAAVIDRRDRLDTAIAGMAADSQFTAVVDRLGCLRGISTLTGFGLAVEIGDWHRLDGRRIGAYLGMVPTEYSWLSRYECGRSASVRAAEALLVLGSWRHGVSLEDAHGAWL